MMLTVKRGGLVERALRGPTLHRQPDLIHAQQSRWMYAVDDERGPRLTPLGALHTLIGLTLWVKD